jgi:tetratricopeptide (TPR) repeat protein
MSDEIKRLMNSPNVEDRKRAVRKLAETHDTSALKYLEVIFKTDASDEVRELASKAGRYLKQNAGKQPPPVVRQTYAPPPIEEEDDFIEEEPSNRSSEEEAKDLMRRAKEQFDDGNVDEAQKLAARAFAKHRDLKNDLYYMGMLAHIMQTDREDAIMALVDYIKGTKTKRKNTEKHLDDTSFGDLIFYYILIALTVLGGTILLNVGVSLALRPEVEQLAQVMEGDPMTSNAVKNSMAQLQQVLAISPDNVGRSVGAGVQTGVTTLISLTISYFFINMVANGMAGGNGTFNGFVRSTMGINVVGNIVSYLLLGGFAYFYLRTIFQGIYASLIADAPEPYQAAVNNAQTMAGSFAIVTTLLYIVLGVMLVRAISRNYKLGFLEGCGTLMVAIMVAGCSWCAIIFGSSAVSFGFLVAGAR